MATLTPDQVASYWRKAGGASWATGIALAVSRAESGFNPDASSPADDWGLWQINSINFAHLGLNRITARDPLLNAEAAVTMSGGGQNWAAWCTAWNEPNIHCGHGSLPVPQADSPAGQFLATYASYGTHDLFGSSSVATPKDEIDLTNAWTAVQQFHGAYAKTQYAHFINTANALKGLQR